MLIIRDWQLKGNKKQQGVALLMAITIVALVAIISINMIAKRQLETYRTSNLIFSDQAWQFDVAIERWGMSILSQDFKQDKNANRMVDSVLDFWNTSLADFDVDNATIDSKIFDLQGRLNLNNLVRNGKLQKDWLHVYQRLLVQLKLPAELALTLTDWMDEDEQPMSSGAEDIYYMSLEPPYRSANQALSHRSELFLIKGYTEKHYNILKHYVYVAPTETRININTTSGVVLQALIQGLNVSEAEGLMAQVAVQAFAKSKDLLQSHQMENKEVNIEQITVTSDYFVVNSNAIIDKIEIFLQSVLYRNNTGAIHVVSRQLSQEYEKPVNLEDDQAGLTLKQVSQPDYLQYGQEAGERIS